jgi:hypothetical protein
VRAVRGVLFEENPNSRIEPPGANPHTDSRHRCGFPGAGRAAQSGATQVLGMAQLPTAQLTTSHSALKRGPYTLWPIM